MTRRLGRWTLLGTMLLVTGCPSPDSVRASDPEGRPPADEADLRFWLENAVRHHRFAPGEAAAALGLVADEAESAIRRFGIEPADTAPLTLLPYPGGRHPRLGFLEGAVRPRRETKISVFSPWGGYAVVDLPEAIWSNLGLTYLAHSHIPTIWDRQGVAMEKREWTRTADGGLQGRRTLPNGISFGASAGVSGGAVRMELWLSNGTKEKLSDLRVQVCVLLRGLPGFDRQTNDNKVFSGPYAACRDASGRRWLITAWRPLHRTWANAPCPCLHSDPKFPDCAPGETVRLEGVLWFYEGEDLPGEIARFEDARRRGAAGALLRVEVVDADTGKPLPSRAYLQGADGSWHFPQSEGSAVKYRKERGGSNEAHATLSAGPFSYDLPPGAYALTVERGKEYLPASRTVEIGAGPVGLRVPLERWIDMAALGWYSGDTHVHRSPEELPNLLLAEDLNVAFPLAHWVTQAFAPPPKGGAEEPRLVRADPTHVFWPRNTEYEIFSVARKSHTLGAFFVLNHRTAFEEGVPPVGPVARRARAEGALLDLDKHNWPWSMALVPVMDVDLFELANNHLWRAPFAFRDFGEREAEYMKVERDGKGWTEGGWIEFGLRNYYALLDCGFRLRPTAGCASGVHPVPLGFGRVYVELPRGFGYEAWLRGLDEGRSFVTTGPMLLVRMEDRPAGSAFKGAGAYALRGRAVGARPLSRLEVVVNGEVARALVPANRRVGRAYESPIEERIEIEGSSWVALRCREDLPAGGVRFAHTAPFHVEVEGKPLRPRREEVEYLSRRVEAEIARSRALLPAAALEEYERALQAYRRLLPSAR